MKNKKSFKEKDIKLMQKELFELGILEEFTDYRISEKFLNDFLDNYEKNYGKQAYIIGSQLIPLFERLRAKYPDANEEEIISKSHKLIPIIRAMFHHERTIPIIKK